MLSHIRTYLFVTIDVPSKFPLEGIEAVGDHVVPDPFLDLTPTLGHNPADLKSKNNTETCSSIGSHD
jgi:hypothetical protein